ncbi:MAG: NAD(P)-dependent oxidoreductase [Balneolaceae bacterium]|jgi:3-hydroxyisobutyrate dehydrogenase/glyoxylate/succinic semialdehyde reductase
MNNIGFYGLGIMGSRMASNLLSSKTRLMVYNRTHSKTEILAQKGAKVAQSPRELADFSDILFTMLSTPEAVEQAATGNQGFLTSLHSRSLWVDCSTVNPSFSRSMAEKADSHNIRFLDAPVAGSKAPAESGDLLFLVGGSEDDIEKCRPFLKMMGQKIIHAGNTGMGSSLKMVFNLLLGEAMTAFAEGLNLGESLGLPKDMLLNILVNSPVVAPFIAGKKNKIARGDFEAEFPLKWMLKDLELASQSGYETNAPLPAGSIVKEIYTLALKDGLGDEDFSAIYSYLNSKK